MGWIASSLEIPAVRIRIRFETGTEPLTYGTDTFLYTAVLDTGSPVTVVPGRVVDAVERLNHNGGFSTLYRVELLSPNRETTTLDLPHRGSWKGRKAGQEESKNYERFLISVEVEGRAYNDLSTVVMPPVGEDEKPHVIVGREFLFMNGRCSFDRIKRRFKLGRCCWF